MFCQNCGQEIPDDSRFCDYCGQPQQVYDGQGTGEQQGYGPYGEPPVNYDTQGYGNQPVYGTEPKRNSAESSLLPYGQGQGLKTLISLRFSSFFHLQ